MAYGTVKVNEVLALISSSAITTSGGVKGATISATGAAPDTNTASTVVIGQKDSSVGSKASLDIETEEVVAVVGTFTASHKLAVWINGVEYNLQLDAV